MRSECSGGWRRRGSSRVLSLLVGGALLAACADQAPRSTEGGLLAGQVVVSGPLRGAAISVDQLDPAAKSSVKVRAHVGDTTSSTDDGSFELDVDTYSGLLLVTAKGGSFTDLATGAVIQLDPGDGLTTIIPFRLLESDDEALVSPVGHLIAALTRWEMGELGDVDMAEHEAEARLDRHFAAVPWPRIKLGSLDTPATSPTEPVRAALVQAALSFLAKDIGDASGASRQAVNVLRLTQQLAADLVDGRFDGNDMNSLVFGEGLQLGDCAPIPDCMVPANDSCALDACRTLCDLYVGTPRTLFGGEMTKVIQSPSVNHTGLVTGDVLSIAKALANDVDDLFGQACTSNLDRVPPTITWQSPSPGDGEVAGGQVMLRVVATDDNSTQGPTVAFKDYPDTDGDPTNSIAVTTVNTRVITGGVDGPLPVTAIAKDLAGNTQTSTRMFIIDNTPPVVTIDSTGFFVDSANVWWTDTPGPTLHGTISDPHPKMVQIAIGGIVVATATTTGTAWAAQLPVDALSANGNEVTILGTDLAGNVGSKVQALRLDATPPVITVDASPVFDEINSHIDFQDTAQGSFAVHQPMGTPVDLATTGACTTVHKYAHLLFQPGPNGTHSILGSSGALNPLTVNVVVSDDGVGVQPSSTQYRVMLNNGGTLVEQLPWTQLPPGTVIGSTTRYAVSLFRDGTNAIPALGTTNGEYHIEFRAVDRFSRESQQQTCWNHVILGPQLQQADGPGKKAEGFQRALYSTTLNPNAGETGDFAAKFLNDNAAGAAMWRWRIKNYLGVPVYLTVNISQNVSATVTRRFRIVDSLTAFTTPTTRRGCAISGCIIAPQQTPVFDSGLVTTGTQSGLKLQARLFVMNGNETGTEIPTCPGCTADDTTQTYVFEIPARVAPQGSPLPEYAVLTYLRPTLPAGQGTNVLMAPSDPAQPDGGAPGPYTEFVFEGKTLTGTLIGPLSTAVRCVDQDQDENGRFCTEIAFYQRYSALVRVEYALANPLVTSFSFAGTTLLPPTGTIPGKLEVGTSSTLTTDEVPLP